MQPDTLIPGVDSPQSWNRFSYVSNNPVRFNDPTGHVQEDDDYDCHGCTPLPASDGDDNSGSNSEDNKGNPDDNLKSETNDCNYGDICFDYELRNNCESQFCHGLATGIGLMATAYDSAAAFMNLSFALGADIAGLLMWPEGYLAIAALYKIASPIPNIMGTYGGLLWGLQGVVFGDTYASLSGTLSSDLFRNNATMSMTYSQDTAVSVVLDGGGWLIPEPNIAAIVSEIGIAYDLGRNPLAPYISSAPPLIPTVIAPTYSVSINLSSLFPITTGWSLLPPP